MNWPWHLNLNFAKNEKTASTWYCFDQPNIFSKCSFSATSPIEPENISVYYSKLLVSKRWADTPSVVILKLY